jgi:hypothetical protein
MKLKKELYKLKEVNFSRVTACLAVSFGYQSVPRDTTLYNPGNDETVMNDNVQACVVSLLTRNALLSMLKLFRMQW